MIHSDLLFNSCLNEPLLLQGLKTLKVAFHHATKDEVSIHSMRLPKNSIVGDVLNDLKTKVELSHPTAELRLLEVFNNKIYKVQQVQNFGDSFFLVVHESETLSEVKVHIQKKLQILDEEFSKWKFAYVSLGRPDYLQDSDVVLARFQRSIYGAWEQYLGMEHADTTPKRAYTANQNRHTLEKPVKIYN